MPSGELFLHQHDSSFHHSEAVEQTISYLKSNGEKIPNEPEQKIAAHLGFLASAVNDGVLTGDRDSIERQVGFCTVKEEDISEASLQREFEANAELANKRMLIGRLQDEQEESLVVWAKHLNNKADHYPDWFKYYAWNYLVKLGTFNKEKSNFSKRSRGTTAPYPELVEDGLGQVYDVLEKAHIQGAQVQGGLREETLHRLLQHANFGKLYGHFITKALPASPERLEETEGSWVMFKQSVDPYDAGRLSGWLRDCETDWCTHRERKAAAHLQGGDFYVYCSRDETGEDAIPRIAIRMKEGKLHELRGIASEQNLEGGMVEVAARKLASLPGGEHFQTKLDDMRRLNRIEEALSEDLSGELSDDDLRFLYEMDRPIRGFGQKPDSRIAEIRVGRDFKQDLSQMLRLHPDEISLTQKEALTEGIKYHHGDLSFRGLTDAEGMKFPEKISGSLWLNSLASAENLILPREIGGSLWLEALDVVEKKLTLPEKVGNNILFEQLTNAECIEFPKEVGGKIWLTNISSEEKMTLRGEYPYLKFV